METVSSRNIHTPLKEDRKTSSHFTTTYQAHLQTACWLAGGGGVLLAWVTAPLILQLHISQMFTVTPPRQETQTNSLTSGSTPSGREHTVCRKTHTHAHAHTHYWQTYDWVRFIKKQTTATDEHKADGEENLPHSVFSNSSTQSMKSHPAAAVSSAYTAERECVCVSVCVCVCAHVNKPISF